MLNDRQSPLAASKLTNIRSVHEGRGFQDGEWMAVKGQTTTQNEQKSLRSAGMQSEHWQTTLRSKRRQELKQAPSCCDWLCVNHLGFCPTPPPHPPFTFQEKKNTVQNGKTKQQKEKLWTESLLGLKRQSLYFFDLCWILVDSMWEWEVCKVSIPGANFECFEEWYSH